MHLMKYKLLILLLFSFSSAFSQTEKGTLLLSGNASFQMSTEGGVLLNFNPGLGVFVKNNLAIGGALSVITDFEGTTGLGVGVFIKPYFGKKEKGKFFLNAGISYFQFTEDYDGQLNLNAGAGYAFFLNKSIALEVGLHYLEHAGFNNGIISLGTGFNIHWKRQKRNTTATTVAP